ncbi:MAG: hypothetical protein R6U46_00235 [Marinilabilia sp.]
MGIANYNLTKPQKKAAREIIDKGLQRDYQKGLEKVENILGKWRSGKMDNQEAYLAMYKAISKHDKYLARRYDNITGSRYLLTIYGLYVDKVISEEELDPLGEEVKKEIVE